MLRTRRITGVVVFIGLLALTALTGCGRSGSSDASSGKPLIGVSSRFIAEVPFLGSLTEEAKKEGNKRGYDVDVVNASGDAARQIQQMKNFINKGAKAIIIEPVNDQGVAAGIAAATKAKIPVIVVNDQVSPALASQVACSVRDNSIEVAAGIGRDIAKRADAAVPKNEKITLYVQMIYPHELLTQTRDKGFMKGWDEYFAGRKDRYVRVPNIYGEAKPEKTLSAMRSTINAHRGLDVVFDMTDTVWGAVQQSLKESGLMDASGKSKVLVGGFDADMRVVTGMANDPNFAVVATGANEPRTQAMQSIDEAIAASTGKPTGKCQGNPPTRLLDPVVVTKENAKDFVDPKSKFAYGQAGA
jgi:ribose transport system substrate-binding protein